MLQVRQGIENTVIVELGKNEIDILIKSCNFVNNEIIGGFHARLGADREELEALILLMQSALKNFNHQPRLIQISVEQLRILVQVLNEVCHGIYISNFKSKIGSNRNSLKSVLRLTKNSYRALENSREDNYN